MELLLSIGFCITGFTIFLLLRKREHKAIHKFSIAILLLWFIRFLLFYLKDAVDLTNMPWLFFLDQNLFFLDGVFLFWFSKSLNRERFSYLKESIHLIPFTVAIALTVSLFISYNSSQLNDLYQESKIATQSHSSSPEEIIFILVILLQNVIYLFLGYKKINQYNQNILSNYSTIDRVQINWLSKFFKIWAILLVVPLIIFFINYIYPLFDLNLIETFLISSFVAAAIYFSVHITNQYFASFLLDKNEKTNTKNIQKHDIEEFKEAYAKLQELMEVKKPYLNEGLTLAMLSEQMHLKSIKLSNIINTQTSGNFYDYINSYRIEAIKKELITTKEQIIIIAYNNGFSSKSTFNKVFKDTTGNTPSQYRKMYTLSSP
ncbi:helix-turn-helix domain-containing protein [Tenacibaculum sp. nBUS_03]|uniref:helix-turn-helix domain-containing protein n=1 Tax=Tenacibaculum sp. nBUS_03 TaxID=3395320 RepID=UPI003EB74D86